MTATDDSAIDRLDRRIVPPIFLSFFFLFAGVMAIVSRGC